MTPDVFTYADHQVRTVVIDGEPWFVLADVCKVLGLARGASQVADRLPDGVRQAYPIVDALGRVQQATIVNEPGLYRVVLRSDAPGAEPFIQWVTDEVLPQIRRTGSYGTPAPAELTREQILVMALDAERERQAAIERAEVAEQAVAVLEQPAAAWNGLASGAGDYTVSDTAKVLCRAGIVTGPRKLYTYLRDDAAWVFRRGGRWQAMQAAINAGYVVERLTGGYFDDVTGERKQGDPQVRVTPLGIQQLLTRMGVPALPEVSA